MLVVTAYYPIAKCKHSQDQYFKWIDIFFKSVNCDIICFCPSEVADKLNSLKTHRTTLITRDFNSFDMMSDSQMNVWKEFNKIDPENRYHSPELYAVWATKQEFVRTAINLVNRDVYIWCDIGCFRTLRNGSFQNIKKFIVPNKITCLSILDTIGGGVLAGDKSAWINFSNQYLSELSRNPHGKDQVIYKRILNSTNANIISATEDFGDPWFYLTFLFSY